MFERIRALLEDEELLATDWERRFLSVPET
jgi:hypothetical protein